MTGPETWGLRVPGCPSQAGGVRTRGAGATLTAGKEKAGDTAGKEQGAAAGGGVGSETGARDQSALPQVQGRREGERATGRGGSGAPAEGAADRDVGPAAPGTRCGRGEGRPRAGQAGEGEEVSGRAGRSLD